MWCSPFSSPVKGSLLAHEPNFYIVALDPPSEKACLKTCHLRILAPLKHKWNYAPPLLKAIWPVVKARVFTVALRPAVTCLSAFLCLSLPSPLPFGFTLLSFLPVSQPSSPSSLASSPLFHFSGCLAAPFHKLQADSCLRAFAYMFLLPPDIQMAPTLPSFNSNFRCHLIKRPYSINLRK